MNVEMRPLAGAVGIAVVIATGGAAVAMAKHHGHTNHASAGTSADATITGYSGGLHTLAPDAPATLTPSQPPDVHPDTGVALLWATVPTNDQVLAAVDWSGVVHGRLTLPVPRSQLGTIIPSPDGQRLLLDSYNDAVHVWSAQGRDLGAVGGTVDDSSWAGDDTHVCAASREAEETSAQLSLVTIGGRTRAVTTMHWPQGNGGMRVVACNVSSDLAVLSVSLGDDNAGHVVEYKVVRLSTGATLRDVYPPGPRYDGKNFQDTPGALWDITASADARFLILTPYAADSMVRPQTLQVADTVTGRVEGHFTAEEAEFAGDSSHVLADSNLLDWRTGRSVAIPGRCCPAYVAVRPGSSDFAVSIPTGPPPTPNGSSTFSDPNAQPPPDDYVVLRADGSTAKLACCGSVIL